MVAALKEKQYDFTFKFDDGVHSDAHGGSIMPEMLRWLWRDYPK
jgi:enterochelin esterase family protein